jgi:hypothetical protein
MLEKKRRISVSMITLGALAFAIFPSEGMAETTAFGASAFTAQADIIKGFLFGPAVRVAGIMGGAYGLLQAVVTSNVRPLIMFGGIGLGASLMENFVNTVFTATAILP